ncbi:MAG TPA: septum formation initiator family protein [Gaiellaceae bacterium]
MAARKKRRRRLGGRIARRWFALGALVLVGLLYYRPLHDYFGARSEQAAQVTAVRKLQRERAALTQRLRRAASDAALAAEARTLGYLRPGEHLFIVKDIPQWRRRQHGGRRRSH